ncbi:MAG: ChbG/HpnK family deacetylase [Myxococcota bacterium]
MGDQDTRWLIVNGDDFGMSPGVSRGIVDAHRRGILTSTSLMVERPAAAEAAALAREAPELSVGLHLELDGSAPADPRKATQDQLRRFEQLMGRPPTHLDSHHDVHQDPRVLPEVLEATRPLGIPVRGHSPATCLTRFYGEWAGEIHLEQVSVESLIGMLETDVKAGVTELMCHPGYVDAGLDSSYARAREPELYTLCDARVRTALDQAGIRLLGFRDFPALLAGKAEG